MKSILLSFLFISISALNLHSQKQVLSFKNEVLSKRISKDSYTLSNTKNNDLAVVIIERKQIFAYLFNSNFEKKNTVETKNIKAKYNKALGYSISDERYNILYTNQNKNKFSILSLDFKSQTGTSKEIDIDFKDHLFLDAINYNNKLYLLSANGNSEITIRLFDNETNFKIIKTFSLEEISNDTNLISSKMSFGPFLFSGKEVSNITKIDRRVPNSIEQTSNENKIYQNGSSLYLTFDVNKKSTQIYTIDLESLNLSLNVVPYPEQGIESFKKFNSFLYKNKLYQIASSKEEMKFAIKTLEGKLIKDFYINKNKPITIKNSPIIQEGATALPFVTKRKLEATKKYLRKITSGQLGLTVLEQDQSYYISLGGFEYIHNGGPMMVTTANGNFTGFNTTYASYSGYTTTKSTYFNSIFDLNFNHKKGDFKDSIFDKIEAYKTPLRYITAEDVFFHDNTLYFGYFNQKNSEYNLIKF